MDNAPNTPPANTTPLNSIELQVNGEVKTCAPGTTLPEFLVQIGLNPKLIAVEYNGEILTRSLWASTVLQPNDRLEVVTIVGGG
ncbi:MAG: sulfur carrier protein ThiS [Cyanobacteria bacterium P01_F01_bin.53]